MNIAMLTTAGERCGIGSYSAALVASLRTLPDTQVRVIPIAVGEQEPSHYEALAAQLNAADVDLVHIQHEFSFWGFPLPSRSKFAEFRQLIRQPVVLTAHTTLPLRAIFPTAGEWNPWRWLMKKRLVADRAYRQSVEVTTFDNDATIVHTDAAHEEFLSRGLCPERLFVVPMGIPAPVPSATAGEAFRDRYGLQGKRLLTLFGYVTPNKGYALVADILPKLPPDVVFVIAGGARRPVEEEYVEDVRRYLRQRRLEQRVLITGYLSEEEVADAMEAADIALVPHTQATNSYSVTLPLSHGRPVLASDLACFREMAQRGDCVELFRSGDRHDFLRRLTALLENPERRRELSANALRYTERFGWPNVAAMTRDIYRTALDAHRGNGHRT
ncbi:MAG TPA: glycosyltransferase family 4 protein [Thermoanaerobaculia bacterium]|jgi:glycosyltransferase involved in cell wall biosynthesis|nr:glycosyltransferase family 4 protein [Thermoanaerobaculia bacterium]